MDLRVLSATLAVGSTDRRHAEEPWMACHNVSAADPERSWPSWADMSRRGVSRPGRFRRAIADLLVRTAEVLARSDPAESAG
jgi:hypothetical protein